MLTDSFTLGGARPVRYTVFWPRKCTSTVEMAQGLTNGAFVFLSHVCTYIHLFVFRQRLRRLVFSGKFYVLYGGVGWGGGGAGPGTGGAAGMGTGIEIVEEKRWVNRPHPRLGDPEDKRGAQLRRQQVSYGTTSSVLCWL